MNNSLEPDVIKKYQTVCWILKIRLISTRLIIWNDELSYISIQHALFQLRLITEGYVQLHILASTLQHGGFGKTLKKSYKVRDVFKTLRQRKQKLPLFKTSTAESPGFNAPIAETLDFIEVTEDDEQKIANIWSKSGNHLHRKSGFSNWPETEELATQILGHNYHSLRADHQWMWNILWHHSIIISETEIINVHLGSQTDSSAPKISYLRKASDEGKQDPVTLTSPDFIPEFLADFQDGIDWKKYSE